MPGRSGASALDRPLRDWSSRPGVRASFRERPANPRRMARLSDERNASMAADTLIYDPIVLYIKGCLIDV